MAKTTIAPGQRVPSTFFNAVNAPQFIVDEGGEEFNGVFYRIRDNFLSNDPTQIKSRVNTFFDTLRVSAGTGLSVSYTGGVVALPDGGRLTIAPGNLTIPNNQTSIIHLNSTGAIAAAVSTALPVVRLDLAQVTTVAGAISGAIVDLRPRFQIKPVPFSLKLFGGSGEQGDYTLNSGSATLGDGLYYFRNLTIGAGATLNISQSTKIHCSGSASIAGNVIISTFATGGASFSTSSTSNIGGLSGGGSGNGSGSSVVGGKACNYSGSLVGSGGASGFLQMNASSGGFIAPGGEGGGGLWIEAAGTITLLSGASILARGGNGGVGGVTSGTGNISGGGGGSGGLILLSSLQSIVVPTGATLDVRGGSGGAAAAGAANGGGGGGGGLIVLISPNNNTTGSTILLTGGAAGTAIGAGSLGGGNGGGYGGAGGGGGTGGSAAQNGLLILRNFRAVG